MAVNELETWVIHGQTYVEPKEAARYLGVQHKTALGYIAHGKLVVVRIESRQFVELDTLQRFASTRRPRKASRQGR